MDAKRLYKRCALQGTGMIKGLKGAYDTHFIINEVSASGASIKTKEELNEGQILDIRIVFSAHIIEININVKAMVVRTEKSDGNNLSALKFLDLSEQDKIEIDEMIEYSCDDSNIGIGMHQITDRGNNHLKN